MERRQSREFHLGLVFVSVQKVLKSSAEVKCHLDTEVVKKLEMVTVENGIKREMKHQKLARSTKGWASIKKHDSVCCNRVSQPSP